MAFLTLVACILPVLSGVGAAPINYHLTGEVATDEGSPLAGATITATNLTNSSETYSITSASNGVYDLLVPGGTYLISASLENFSLVASDNNSSYNRSISQDTSNLNFVATELGTVTGFVDNFTAPIFDATIVLVDMNYRTYVGHSDQPRGNYSIPGVMPGVYTARAEKDGFITNYSQTPIFVTRGGVTVLSFSLEAQIVQLSGRVTFNGNPVEDVLVTLSSGGKTLNQTTTDAQGKYLIYNITAGAYTLTYSKEGFKTTQIESELLELENTKDVSITYQQLPGGGGFIAGFDLSHSLMVVGFILALTTVVVAVIIRYRVGKKPELLPEEEIEKGS